MISNNFERAKRNAFVLTACILCFFVTEHAFSDLLIKNARLIDGTGNQPRTGVNIVIAGNRIGEITFRRVDEAGMRVIDATGMTVLPGLTDAHMHTSLMFRVSSWAEPGFMDPKNSIHSEEDIQLYLQEEFPKRAKAILGMGITTVVDTGGFWPHLGKMRKIINSGAVTGPHIYITGPIFSGPGGHPSVGVCFNKSWCVEHMTVATNNNLVLKEAVKKLATAGVDGLKLIYDDGTNWVETPVGHLDSDNLRTIVDEGHRQDLIVSAHIWLDEARAVEAVLAGLDVFVHFVPISIESNRNKSGNDLPILLNRYDVEVVSTLHAIVADKMIGWYPGIGDGELNQKALEYINTTLATSVKQHIDAGVTLIFGTDGGWVYLDDYDTSYANHEVNTMRLAGLTEKQIIQTLTGNAAKHPMTPEDIGTIEVGKFADIILLNNDPLEDITNIFRPSVVIKNGEIVIDKRQ